MALPEFFLSGTYQDHNCPIGLVEYKPYNLKNYIKLSDYVEYISENKERFQERLDSIHANTTRIPNATGFYDADNIYVYPIVTNEDYIYFRPSSFLISDITSPYIEDFPLFYEHRFMFDMYSEQKNPDNYIKIRRNGKDLINEKSYILEYGNYNLTESGNLNDRNIIWNRTKVEGNYFRCRVLLPYDQDYLQYYDIEYDAYINGNIVKRTELINRKPIYEEGYHYNVTPSGIELVVGLDNGIRPSGYIYLQKEYTSRIFFKPYDNYLSPSGNTNINWYLTLNPGQFVQLSGIFIDENKYFYIPKEDSFIIISGEQPNIYNQNVFKTTKFPIYIYSSGYPSYSLTSGITININNEELETKYIDSWDTEKGFIRLNKNVTTSDIITADYQINTQENYMIRNLDLNPKNTLEFKLLDEGVSFALGPSGYFPSGLAFFPTIKNPNGDFNIETSGWKTSTDSTVSLSGIFDTQSVLIGEIIYKSLPKDLVNIVDCRRLGGGLKPNSYADEDSWYYDIGKWDGEIMQSNSSLIIQIPSGVKNYFISKFYEHGSFIEENYNEQILLGTDPSGVLNSIGFNDLKYYNAVKEANKHIIDCIERYLPVGTEYVILDESYNIWNMLI